MITLNATDVRKDFSTIVDKAVREKPQFIKRTRDYMMLSDVHFLESLLEMYHFTADIFIEDDNSITLSLNELDIVENRESETVTKQKLAQAILDYAEDFYKDFSYWSLAPNSKAHIPYVFKALALDDAEKKEVSYVTMMEKLRNKVEKRRFHRASVGVNFSKSKLTASSRSPTAVWQRRFATFAT